MNSRYGSTLAARGEISTNALIHRALAEFDLPQLEAVETRLERAIKSGLLKQTGQTALAKVRGAIARRKLESLFTSARRLDAAPLAAMERTHV